MDYEIDVYGNTKDEYRIRIEKTKTELALWKERLATFEPYHVTPPKASGNVPHQHNWINNTAGYKPFTYCYDCGKEKDSQTPAAGKGEVKEDIEYGDDDKHTAWRPEDDD